MAAIVTFPIGRAIPAFDPRPLDRDEVRATLVRQLDQAFDLVDALLARLDHIDGDIDFEPEPAEASADEWTGRGAQRFASVGRPT